MTQTRGVRNNNPGNIDHNPKVIWQGELAFDPAIEKRFCRFRTPELGIRALAKTLLTYYNKHGLKTPKAIINRWAPSSENDTGSYASAVARALSVTPDTEINLKNKVTLVSLVIAIIAHENAGFQYPAQVVLDGVSSALE